jgi:hypothetical protein
MSGGSMNSTKSEPNRSFVSNQNKNPFRKSLTTGLLDTLPDAKGRHSDPCK